MVSVRIASILCVKNDVKSIVEIELVETELGFGSRLSWHQSIRELLKLLINNSTSSSGMSVALLSFEC